MSKQFKKGKESIPSKASNNNFIPNTDYPIIEVSLDAKKVLGELPYEYVAKRLGTEEDGEIVMGMTESIWDWLVSNGIFLGRDIERLFPCCLFPFVNQVKTDEASANQGACQIIDDNVLINFCINDENVELGVYVI